MTAAGEKPPVTGIHKAALPLTDEIWRDLWIKRPPIQYAVDPLIAPKKVVVIAAYGSSMKSWLLLSLALDVASGSKWLGRFQCEKRKVLYLDYENDDDELSRRCRGLSSTPVEGFDPIIMPSKFLASADLQPTLMKWASEYGMICVDTYSAGTGNSEDENKPIFAKALQTMKRVAAKTGCIFVVLHFTKKPKTDKDGNVVKSSDMRMDLRGTSQLYNAVDVIFHTESETDDTCSVFQTKSRGQKKYPEFSVAIEGGMAPAPVRLVALSAEERAAKAALEVLRIKFISIKKILEKHPKGLSANDLLAETKGKREAQFAIFKNLEKNGFLQVVEKKYVLRGFSSPTGSRKLTLLKTPGTS